MRGKAKEIEQVFQTHGFSINSIIRNIMGTFNILFTLSQSWIF